jgi:hypothetical protein
MIVIEIGQDNRGGFAFCIGGNESDRSAGLSCV